MEIKTDQTVITAITELTVSPQDIAPVLSASADQAPPHDTADCIATPCPSDLNAGEVDPVAPASVDQAADDDTESIVTTRHFDPNSAIQVDSTASAAEPSLAEDSAHNAELTDVLNKTRQELAELQASLHEAEIEAALNWALARGKIVPAALAYHRVQCQQDGGLAIFSSYCEQAPVIAGPSGLDRPEAWRRLHSVTDADLANTANNPGQIHKTAQWAGWPPGTGGFAYNSNSPGHIQKICQCLGISERELRATVAREDSNQ